jgi:hypothetical protein
MDDFAHRLIKLGMAEYDRLPVELRAVVQEYGVLPWDPSMPAEEFRAGQQYMRELDQQWLLKELAGEF